MLLNAHEAFTHKPLKGGSDCAGQVHRGDPDLPYEEANDVGKHHGEGGGDILTCIMAMLHVTKDRHL